MAGQEDAGWLVAVVEDNERNARLVEDVLVAHGFRVEVVATGAEALVRIPGLAPDLVMVDIQLPDTDGVQLLHELRKSGLESVPAMAVTAYAMTGDRQRFLGAGFDGYLAKPIDVATLAGTVRDLIEAPGG